MKIGKQAPVVLITGSARGLGAYLAVALEKKGAVVIRHTRKKPGRSQAPGVIFDVRNRRAVEAAVRKIIRKWGRIDWLINCVGPYTPKRIDRLTETEWRDNLESILHGAFFLSRAVLPQMRKQKSGKIVHIGDAYCGKLKTTPVAVAYKIAKNGLITLVHALKQTEGPRGIEVRLIAPGFLPHSIVPASRVKGAKKTSYEEILSSITT